ncbi:hypothetical protein CDAR_172631 [Caerostris darwini]|uniref:Uncharacterized protein n=1 Tax=Caerostris darwini TaxID=1538125 RepID=A0AAV4MED6_9ARAC|nr:hypothetical protein CDAR_172631 [Caerostris darwini]
MHFRFALRRISFLESGNTALRSPVLRVRGKRKSLFWTSLPTQHKRRSIVATPPRKHLFPFLKKWKDHLLNCFQPNSSFAPYLCPERTNKTKSVDSEDIFKVLIVHHRVFRTIDLHDNGREY